MISLSKLSEAEVWYRKAINVIKDAYGEIHPKIASVYRSQASYLAYNGNFDEALNLVQSGLIALSFSFKSEDFNANPKIDSVLDEREYLNLVLEKSRIFRLRASGVKDLKSSLKLIDLASSMIDRLRRGYMSENSKLFLQEKASFFYEQALSLCYKLYQESKDESYLDKALFFLEKSRSSVLSEALQVSEVNSIQGVPDEVLVAEKKMDGYVSSIELKLGDAEIGDSDSLQSELRKQLFHARASVDSLVNIIRNNYPNYYDLKYEQEVVSSKQIQETLPEDGLSISIYEGEENWYVYSMSQTDIKFSRKSKLGLTNQQVIELIEFEIQIHPWRSF